MRLLARFPAPKLNIWRLRNPLLLLPLPLPADHLDSIEPMPSRRPPPKPIEDLPEEALQNSQRPCMKKNQSRGHLGRLGVPRKLSLSAQPHLLPLRLRLQYHQSLLQHLLRVSPLLLTHISLERSIKCPVEVLLYAPGPIRQNEHTKAQHLTLDPRLLLLLDDILPRTRICRIWKS